MLNNSNYKAHFALLGANLIYGANYIIAKDVMPDKIGPSAFIFVRILGAGLLFWIINLFIREKIHRKDYFRFLLCAIFGVVCNQLFFFHGLNLTSPIDASIILTMVPILVMVFSAIFLKEAITKNKLLGILIGGSGALVLITYGSSAAGTGSTLGNLYVLMNSISYALYLVLVKPLMKTYKPFTVITWVFTIGFVIITPIVFEDFKATDISVFTPGTYYTIAYVIIGTTFFAYLLNIYALSKVSPSVNGSYIYLQPVISFFMVSLYASTFNDNTYSNEIDLIKIMSCLMVVSGVYLISKKQKTATA